MVCQHWSHRGHHTLSVHTAKPDEGQQLIRAGLHRPEKALRICHWEKDSIFQDTDKNGH